MNLLRTGVFAGVLALVINPVVAKDFNRPIMLENCDLGGGIGVSHCSITVKNVTDSVITGFAIGNNDIVDNSAASSISDWLGLTGEPIALFGEGAAQQYFDLGFDSTKAAVYLDLGFYFNDDLTNALAPGSSSAADAFVFATLQPGSPFVAFNSDGSFVVGLTQSSDAQIPEPATSAVFIAGLLWLRLAMRSRAWRAAGLPDFENPERAKLRLDKS